MCDFASPSPPQTIGQQYDAQRLEVARVALIADKTPPDIEGVHLGLTRGEGAAAGAAGGALYPIVAGAEIAGPFGLVAGVLLMPVFAIGGAISGATGGHSADLLREAEANAYQLIDSGYLQKSLLERIRNYGHENVELDFFRLPDADHGALAVPPRSMDSLLKPTDFVLEIKLLKIALEESLEIDARARLLSVDTGAVLNDSQYQFLSVRHDLTEWMADGAAPLKNTIEYGLQTLAEDIIDENFLLFYPIEPKQASSPQEDGTSDQVQRSENKQVPHYVLSPIYPALDSCFLCERPFSTRPHSSIGSLEFVEVASVQPTLQWERFPREHDLGGSDGSHHQITDVRYELRIFDTAIPASTNILLVPAQQVYEARGIPEPLLTVNSGLNACSDYFWTVRARFKLDGRIRVTEWAGAFEVGGWNEKPWNLRRGQLSYQSPPSWLIGVNPPVPDGPEWFYYPFRTPCDSGKTLAPKH